MERRRNRFERPMLMVNPVRHYDWGGRGESAIIPRLLGIAPVPDRPYAELWIGAHPSAPSELVTPVGRLRLDQAVAEAPQALLGPRVAQRFAGGFPFLLKILDAARPLSIQAHPDRLQAERLHRRDPAHYPDPNPKPELAVAIGEVRAFAGFRPGPEIVRALARAPELAEFGAAPAGPTELASLPAAALAPELRRWVATLIDRAARFPDRYSAAIDAVTARFKAAAADADANERLLVDLRRRYSGPDAGLAFALLLQFVHLQSGQGLYLDAGIPHAYLAGQMVECMANSDNVVRLGLTDKPKDGRALLDILRFTGDPPAVLAPPENSPEAVYSSSAEAFELSACRLTRGDRVGRRSPDGPVVLLVLAGSVVVTWEPARDGAELRVAAGRSVLIPAAVPAFRVIAETAAQVFRVEVPG